MRRRPTSQRRTRDAINELRGIGASRRKRTKRRRTKQRTMSTPDARNFEYRFKRALENESADRAEVSQGCESMKKLIKAPFNSIFGQ
jgi:hypothetical protein